MGSSFPIPFTASDDHPGTEMCVECVRGEAEIFDF
jgi:hypothetical protein